jgi:hypothetical protein
MFGMFLVLTLCTAAIILLGCLTTFKGPTASVTKVAKDPRQERTDLTKAEAEEQLDWLEANGRRGELTFVPGQGFSVR